MKGVSMEFTKAEEKLLKKSYKFEKRPMGLDILGSIIIVFWFGWIIWVEIGAHSGSVDIWKVALWFFIGFYCVAGAIQAHRLSISRVLIRKLQQLRVIESEG